MPYRWLRLGCALAVTCGLISSTQIMATTQISQSKAQVSKRTLTEKLGGAERYLTFVSTDKPIYKAGENVFIRGVVLNGANHKPLPDNVNARAHIAIKGAGGVLLSSFDSNTANSVWGASWPVDAGQAGGEYTIEVTYPSQGYAPAKRKFDVRAFRAQRLNSQIFFLRDGYGPGDKVEATLQVARAEGGIPEGAKVTVDARVDGTQIKTDDAIVDASGRCSVSFSLPSELKDGEGTLSLVIQDGGVVETASKTIPILMQKVDLQIYPEGGDLVAGFKNRVYIQAKQPNGKPADLKCNLMVKNAAGEASQVESFQTEHEGRGRFQFTPEAKKEYFLSIVQPTGMKKTYPLPAIKSKGAIIRSSKDIFGKDEPIAVDIGCSESVYKVTVTKHEVEEVSQTVKNGGYSKQNALNAVLLDVPKDVDGVLTITVWNAKGIPLAERLVFRQPSKKINVSVTAERDDYTPGDYAKLRIKSTDEDGKPISAMVGLTVTDESTLELIDKREQAPHLPVMVYLEPEVKDLADAHVYLDSKNPKAALATDLLLGTQGWRRFALVDVNKFLQENGDDARRALVAEAIVEKPVAVNLHRSFQGYRHASGDMSADEMRSRRLPTLVGVGIGALAGKANSQPNQVGQLPGSSGFRTTIGEPRHKLPSEIGRVEGPRDLNMFQVEPSMIDERHYTSGRAERHQKTSPTLPEGAPIPDTDDDARAVGAYPFGRRYASIREYAHPVNLGQESTNRHDFSDTIYWSTGIKTDATTGEANIGFGLNDSVSTFKVFADGFDENGGIGASTAEVSAIKPLFAEAKLPLEVTAGDQILLPINLVNGTSGNFSEVSLVTGLDRDFKMDALRCPNDSLGAKQRVRWILPVTVGDSNGVKDLTLTAKAGRYDDTVVRKFTVKPQGYPGEIALGGMLDSETSITHTVHIPSKIEPGSLKTKVVLYTTPLGNLTSALERMIQEPNGCFEQTSSTSYPLTMAQQYFLTHANVDPKLVNSAREKLDTGYNKLVSFWCPDKGYEWFGKNPGHEALTAFGILHFTDMAKVRNVDQTMLTTTREWLLKQRDGQGGFTRKSHGLHTWIEDKDCSNSYILWALLESGEQPANLKPELDSLKVAAEKSQNNYVVALAANAFFIAGDTAEAKKLMERLASKQKPDGSVSDVTSSIVGSGGESLEVEGTSLATLAWLRDKKYTGNVERSIKFLADSCKSGRYGSTQATVLALRSIVTYDRQRSHSKVAGKVRMFVDGKPTGDWVVFNETTQGELTLPSINDALTPGDHKVELRMDNGCPMPYAFTASYNTFTPISDKDCKLDMTVKSAQDKIVEGGSTELDVNVTNTSHEVIPNPIAIVGLPGGLEPRHDQLKELVKKQVIDAYEVRGREVVLYWRSMESDAKVHIPLSVIAAIPGTYTGPASRTYLYYTDEHKKWVDGVRVEISPK
ncbi:MAG: MG2 domain-containing protein [Candidatus Obscuribacterales bacterium]|nr:MG2 domain-containing protein [Candidatus Obscuribacterales bacterium]